MQRLSGLDAFFLYLESPTQPLNVCCVLELDPTAMPGGYRFDRFRELLSILHASARNRMRSGKTPERKRE